MADLSIDLILGVVVVAVAAIAIFMFWRVSGGSKKKEEATTLPAPVRPIK